MLDISPLKQALVEKYFMFSDINLMTVKYCTGSCRSKPIIEVQMSASNVQCLSKAP